MSLLNTYITKRCSKYLDNIPSDSLNDLDKWIEINIPRSCLRDEINKLVDPNDLSMINVEIIKCIHKFLRMTISSESPWELARTHNDITSKLFGKPRLTLPITINYGKRITVRELTEDFTYALVIGFKGNKKYDVSLYGHSITLDMLPKHYTTRELDDKKIYKITYNGKDYYGDSFMFLQGFMKVARMWHRSMKNLIQGFSMVSKDEEIAIDY